MTIRADITQEEWDRYRGEVVRVAGEQSRLVVAIRENTNEMVRLHQVVTRIADRLDGLEETTGRFDRQILEGKLATEKRRVRELERRPKQWAKWLGWAVATLLGLSKLYEVWLKTKGP